MTISRTSILTILPCQQNALPSSRLILCQPPPPWITWIKFTWWKRHPEKRSWLCSLLVWGAGPVWIWDWCFGLSCATTQEELKARNALIGKYFHTQINNWITKLGDSLRDFIPVSISDTWHDMIISLLKMLWLSHIFSTHCNNRPQRRSGPVKTIGVVPNQTMTVVTQRPMWCVSWKNFTSRPLRRTRS